MKKSFFALIAASMLLASGSASAFEQYSDDGMTQPSRIVITADLALDTPQGRERLNTRVRVAARNVCGTPSRRNLMENVAFNTCFREAIDRAQPRIAQLISGYNVSLAGRRDGGVVVSTP